MSSLRETKKIQTRQSIITAAQQLFDQAGYKETTLADIAHDANVSPRTIFSYFASKESILFYEVDQIISELSAALSERADKGVITVIREFAAYMQDHDNTSDEVAMQRHCMIQENDDLKKYTAQIGDQLEEVLLKAFADELKLPADALEPKLAAAVMRSALEFIRRSGHDSMGRERARQYLDKTLTFTEAGLRSLSE